MAKISKNNYKLTISYDGSRYYGWEHQPDKDTIQGKLESVISKLTETETEVIGSGRTDAGVHAKGMVANAVITTNLSEQELKEQINRYLPDDICVTDLKIAAERFHARYKAVGKTYRYTCYYGENKPVFDRKYLYRLDQEPDLEKMIKAAGYLTGELDYASFCSNKKKKKSTVRIVDKIDIKKKSGYITFTYHGTGFLQHMVRILTGTLLEVGYGKRTPESIPELIEAMDRKLAGFTAPAQGLCLISVDYN